MSDPQHLSLTASESALLVRFLDELIDHQSNAGCNDIELENTPGNARMMRAVLAHSDYADDPPWKRPWSGVGSFYAPCGDHGLAAYLRRKLAGDGAQS